MRHQGTRSPTDMLSYRQMTLRKEVIQLSNAGHTYMKNLLILQKCIVCTARASKMVCM